MPAERPTILATSMGFNRSRDPWQPSSVFRYAFELAGKPSRPRLCFISTGTGDKQASIDSFYSAFAASEVVTSHLALFDKPNVSNISAHLHAQDVIWVDRGSVVNLLAVWRAHGVDKILRDCWQQGVVLGGESAWSLCWFSGGTTDSFGDVQPFADGLGFLPFANAVHYGERRKQFRECVAAGTLPDGYATDAGAGLHFAGTDLVATISDRKNVGAYRITRQADGTVNEEALVLSPFWCSVSWCVSSWWHHPGRAARGGGAGRGAYGRGGRGSPPDDRRGWAALRTGAPCPPRVVSRTGHKAQGSERVGGNIPRVVRRVHGALRVR